MQGGANVGAEDWLFSGAADDLESAVAGRRQRFSFAAHKQALDQRCWQDEPESVTVKLLELDETLLLCEGLIGQEVDPVILQLENRISFGFGRCSWAVKDGSLPFQDAALCSALDWHPRDEKAYADIWMAKELTEDEGLVGEVDKLIGQLRSGGVLGVILTNEVGEAIDVGAGLAIETDLLDAKVDELVDHGRTRGRMARFWSLREVSCYEATSLARYEDDATVG